MSVKQVFNTSAELDYPTVLPTLDLDFANSKTLDPRITFTRSSGGSYVGADGLIKYAGVNEARFDHDPSTGESLGLLIEESRSNLFTSSVPQEGVWASTNNTLISNSEIAPDGTQRATLIDSDDTASVSHYIILNSPLTTATTYTQTFFVKAGTTRFVQIAPSTGFELTFANFELRDDGIIGTSTVYGASIQRFPNGWYRIGVTQTSTSTVGGGRMILVLGTALTDARLPQPHTSRLSCYVWGAQLEVGAFPTSYIPTEASTRTRAADNARITGKNFSEWYRQDEGTFFVDAAEPSAFVAYQAYLTLQGASITDEIRIWRLNLTTATFNHLLNNATQGVINLGINTIANKIARSYSLAQGIVGSANGGSNVQATLSSTIPVTSLRIGARGNNTFYGNRTYKRIAYYPKRLPNSQLQALTS